MLLVFGAVTVTVRTNDPPALLANAILSSLLQMFYRWLCRRSVGWFQAAPGRHDWLVWHWHRQRNSCHQWLLCRVHHKELFAPNKSSKSCCPIDICNPAQKIVPAAWSASCIAQHSSSHSYSSIVTQCNCTCAAFLCRCIFGIKFP